MENQKIIGRIDEVVYECFCCERRPCTDRYKVKATHKSGGCGKIMQRYICERCYNLLKGIEEGEIITIKKERPQTVTQSLDKEIVSLLAEKVKGGQ